MIDVACVHHIGLAVADLSAACEFYCSCGYAIADRLHLTGPDPAIGNGLESTTLDVAFLSSPAVTLELLQFDPAGRTLTMDDPCFGSVPVATGAPAATDLDGHPLTAVADGVSTTFTTAVPDETARLLGLLGFRAETDTVLTGHGVRIELAPVATTDSVPTPNCPGRMHICCQVADMDRAVDAVTAAGFSMVSTPRVSGNLQWVFVRHDGGPGIELLSITD